MIVPLQIDPVILGDAWSCASFEGEPSSENPLGQLIQNNLSYLYKTTPLSSLDLRKFGPIISLLIAEELGA